MICVVHIVGCGKEMSSSPALRQGVAVRILTPVND